jgi:FkbM family methyltransferase
VLLPKWLKRAAGGFIERRGFARVFDRSKVDTVWIDVGAHLGQGTLDAALANSRLLVFAFEPNWALARTIMGRAANFVVLPMAVSDSDGFAEFFVNTSDESSSLVTMEESGVAHWKDFDLTVQSRIVVPTIRLDTFMRLADLRTVDYLKVDAEGVDLKVVQSIGGRFNDIRQIELEVDIAPDHLYRGAPSRSEVVTFMLDHGYELTESETQSGGRQENLTFGRSVARTKVAQG